jgi:hypothetical protein
MQAFQGRKEKILPCLKRRNLGLPKLTLGLPEVGSGSPEPTSGLPELTSGLPELISGLPELTSGLPLEKVQWDSYLKTGTCFKTCPRKIVMV